MSTVARSLVVFGWYLAVFGALLVVAPNPVLSGFGLPPTGEVWIRVAGGLVLVIGYLDIRMGAADFRPYAWLTVHARTAVFMFFLALVLAGLAQPVVMVVGTVDLAGALWTAAALRSASRRWGEARGTLSGPRS
jgi:hypothetical protein